MENEKRSRINNNPGKLADCCVGEGPGLWNINNCCREAYLQLAAIGMVARRTKGKLVKYHHSIIISSVLELNKTINSNRTNAVSVYTCLYKLANITFSVYVCMDVCSLYIWTTETVLATFYMTISSCLHFEVSENSVCYQPSQLIFSFCTFSL